MTSAPRRWCWWCHPRCYVCWFIKPTSWFYLVHPQLVAYEKRFKNPFTIVISPIHQPNSSPTVRSPTVRQPVAAFVHIVRQKRENVEMGHMLDLNLY
jgi:hypothetical protein